LVEAAHSYFGLARDTKAYDALSHVRIAVYIACTIYWIIMLWREAPQTRELPKQMHTDLLALQETVDGHLQSFRSQGE
jgi:hypothetical protein